MANTTDKTVTSKYQPKSTNVIWVDTSLNPPVEKHFINGRWKSMGGGVTDYNDIKNKPTINGVELDGNKTSSDLGVYSKPSSGIPESDLSSNVQSQLNKHFKGWFASVGYLETEYPSPVVGDYAYVKGAESTDPAAIYECTTAGSWSDSGSTADTSNVQTFAGGEEVNEVDINDYLNVSGLSLVVSSNNLTPMKELSSFNDNENGYFHGWLNNNDAPAMITDNPDSTPPMAWRTYKFYCSQYQGKHLTFQGSATLNTRKYAFYNGNTLVEAGVYYINQVNTLLVPANATILYVIIARYGTDSYLNWYLNEGETLLPYDDYAEKIVTINGYKVQGEGEKKLQQEIDELKASEENNAAGILGLYQHKRITPNYSSVLPTISFNVDISVTAEDFENTESLMSVFERYGIRFGIAVKCESTISNPELDFDIWEKYKEWQNRGYDIINHGARSKIYGGPSANITTLAEAVASIMDCENALQKHGLVSNGWCSPNSVFNDDFLPVLRPLYAYAFTSTEIGKENTRNADPIRLTRTGIDSMNIADIESTIDSYITDNKNLVLYVHPIYLNSADFPNFTLENIETLLQYCIAKRESLQAIVANADDAIRSFFSLT